MVWNFPTGKTPDSHQLFFIDEGGAMTGTVTTRCLNCGQPIDQPKKRQGRHKRRCSPECDKAERKKANRRWRDAHRKQPRLPFLCEPTIDERNQHDTE